MLPSSEAPFATPGDGDGDTSSTRTRGADLRLNLTETPQNSTVPTPLGQNESVTESLVDWPGVLPFTFGEDDFDDFLGNALQSNATLQTADDGQPALLDSVTGDLDGISHVGIYQPNDISTSIQDYVPRNPDILGNVRTYQPNETSASIQDPVAPNSDSLDNFVKYQAIETSASAQGYRLSNGIIHMAAADISQLVPHPYFDDLATLHHGENSADDVNVLSQIGQVPMRDPPHFSTLDAANLISPTFDSPEDAGIVSLESLNAVEFWNDNSLPVQLEAPPFSLGISDPMQETGTMQEIGMPRTTRTTQFSQAHYVNDDRALVPFIRPPYLDIGSQTLMAHNPKTKQPMPREDTVKGESFADALTFVHYSPETDSHDEDCHLQDYGRKKTVLHDEEGNVQGSILVLGSRPNKRAALSPKRREQTALARQEGICERCRLAKKRCDLALKPTPYEKCTGCYSRTYRSVSQMPCFKSKLSECSYFRILPVGPFATMRQAVFDLADASKQNSIKRMLQITQHIGGQELTVYAAEFIPLPGDKLSYNWTDSEGQKRSMPMPHFCLTEIPMITLNIMHYISRTRTYYFKLLQETDELAWKTISKALDFARDKVGSIVDLALNLWATARIIEIPWQFCGSDTLGTKPVSDPTNPWVGKMRLPPIMDTQLDQIVIQQVLGPLRTKILQLLDKLIQNHRPDTWFETYLTIFILLNHTSMSSKHGRRFSSTYGLGTRYANMPQFEGYFHSAKIVLSRFHYICNGSAPLRLDWKKPSVAKFANLKPQEVRFMEETQRIIKEREDQLVELRRKNKYEADLYWCHQMFFDNWDSASPCIEDEVA